MPDEPGDNDHTTHPADMSTEIPVVPPTTAGFDMGETEQAVFSYINQTFEGRPFTYSELLRQHHRDADRNGTDWAMEDAALQGALGSLVRKHVLDYGTYKEYGTTTYTDEELDALRTLYHHLEAEDGWYLKNSFRQDVAEEAVDRETINGMEERGWVSRHGGITYIYERGWRAMFYAVAPDRVDVFEDPYRRAYGV